MNTNGISTESNGRILVKKDEQGKIYLGVFSRHNQSNYIQLEINEREICQLISALKKTYTS